MKVSACFSWNLKRLVLKEFGEEECISLPFIETGLPDVFFGFRIYPFVYDESRNFFNVYFGLVIKAKFNVEVKTDFFVNTNNFFMHIPWYSFTNTDAEFRTFVTSADQFFDSHSGFFDVCGRMKLDVRCTLKCSDGHRKLFLCDYLRFSKDKDFDFLVGGKSVKVHKNVLRQYSTVFAKMFDSDFKEIRDNVIEIHDFVFDTIRYAIDFCYGRSCPDDIVVLIDLLRFADKYDIKDLNGEAEDKLCDLVDCKNVVFILNETRFFASDALISFCMKTLAHCVQNEISIVKNEEISDEMRLKFVKYLFDY